MEAKMPNPSELQRLEEERLDLIRKIKDNVTFSRKAREFFLVKLRALERQLGVRGRPYNSVAFGGDDGENER
jgi:hypothetical protein